MFGGTAVCVPERDAGFPGFDGGFPGFDGGFPMRDAAGD
jgi:hypothetical protein